MDGNLILSLLLIVSVIWLVVLHYQKALWHDRAENLSEDHAILMEKLLQANKDMNLAVQTLDFNKAYLLELGKRDLVCVLNDGQAAQLIQTVGQIVTQTKQGVVN